MKKVLVTFLVLFAFACSNEFDNMFKDPFGMQYYRLKQVDFDGTVTYSDIVSVDNTNPRVLAQVVQPLDVVCTTEGVSLIIGVNTTFISIENAYHDGSIFAEGIEYFPDFCFFGSCFWNMDNDDLPNQAFSTAYQSYTYSGTAGDCTALPITLISFEVYPNLDGSNTVEFITAIEYNSDYVAIERSSDGENWTELTQIASTNTEKETTYTYIDK